MSESQPPSPHDQARREIPQRWFESNRANSWILGGSVAAGLGAQRLSQEVPFAVQAIAGVSAAVGAMAVERFSGRIRCTLDDPGKQQEMNAAVATWQEQRRGDRLFNIGTLVASVVWIIAAVNVSTRLQNAAGTRQTARRYNRTVELYNQQRFANQQERDRWFEELKWDIWSGSGQDSYQSGPSDDLPEG